MRVIFFGSPAIAVPFLEKLLLTGHTVESVVTQPDRPSGRGKITKAPPVKQFAQKRAIPVFQPAKIRQAEEVTAEIKQINPDINIVVAYGQIIPASIIYLPRFKSINVHFSLLPKYRGAAPVQWAILNGEKKTGVTIFELNEKMDEGDILATEATDILESENAPQLEARLAQMGTTLLIDTLARIQDVRPIPQDHSQASYAPRLNKEQGRIDWTKDAQRVDRTVRALTPWPAAFTFFKGQRIIVHAGRIKADRGFSGLPGQVLEAKKAGVEVGCGHGGVYVIERLQQENKKVLDAAEFLRGTKINPADFLE